MRRKMVLGTLAFLIAVSVTACSTLRPDRAASVASGLTSHVLCSQTFVTGADPDQVYKEVLRVQPGFMLVDWLLHYDVDREKGLVTTRIAGMFKSQAAFRGDWGCLLERGPLADGSQYPADVLAARRDNTPLLAPIGGPDVVKPADPRLAAALGRAFAETDGEPRHNTKAVVVVRDGKIIAERYAAGYGVDTPIHGWSATKMVTNSLVGILVGQGRLSLQQTGLLPSWQAPDPRARISLDNLLRQTSGLALSQTNSGLDPSARMQFIEHDMAGFAEQAELAYSPGSRWAYSDGNYLLLSRIIRNQLGNAADVIRFAHRELFLPLGMNHVTLEFDATGTPLGSAFMLASARDWAKLGLLFLNDGVVGGKRLLPEGWVHYSTMPTLDTGYGAGCFTNRVSGGQISNWGVGWDVPGAPHDAYYARGYMGQYVIVVPSERLVIVRMGPSHAMGDDIEGAGRLVADVIAALRAG